MDRAKGGPDPSGQGAREVRSSRWRTRRKLRNLAWIEGNRRKVDQLTNGRVAYIYMPDTAFGGLDELQSLLLLSDGKEAAIIDERFNTAASSPATSWRL